MHIYLRNLIIWTMYIHIRNFIVFYLDDVHPFKESYHLLFVLGFSDPDGDFSFERDNQNMRIAE